MEAFAQNMAAFKKQLQNGTIQKTYQGLMEYIGCLRTYMKKRYTENAVSGSVYYGVMDMTYFTIVTDLLKLRRLKIVVVFVYDVFRFEVWLSGANRDVQAEFWDRIKECEWNQYQMAEDPRRFDFIIRKTLTDAPDFSDLDALTKQIETATKYFIADVEEFLSKQSV